MENEIKIKPGWTKFGGILLLIHGISLCISLILPIGIPIIIASMALIDSADLARKFKKSQDSRYAVQSVEAFTKAYRILGLTTVISFLVILTLGILSLILFFTFLPKEEIQNMINNIRP